MFIRLSILIIIVTRLTNFFRSKNKGSMSREVQMAGGTHHSSA